MKTKNRNKYLFLGFTDKNKEVLKKYTQLWDEIRNSTEKVNNKLREYGKGFFEDNFNSDDNLPLNKILKLQNMTIIIKSVFEIVGKFYLQIYIDERSHEL